MEHVRLIVAIVLSLLVFVAWDLLFDVQPPVPPAKSPTETAERQPAPADPDARKRLPQQTVNIPATTFKSITVDTGLYRAQISEKGAALQRFMLKDYKETSGSDAPQKELIPEENRIGTALVGLGGNPDAFANAVYTTNYSGDTLQVRTEPQALSFFWTSPKGLVLEKRYVFYPDSYKIDMRVTVTNQSDQPVDPELTVSMINPPPEGGSYSFHGPSVYIDQSLEEIDVGDIEDQGVYSGVIQWAALVDQYFLTALVPGQPLQTSVELKVDPGDNLLHVVFEQPSATLSPNQQQQYDFSLYMGPKRMSVLSTFGNNLEKAVDFGFFDIIAKPCLWLMNAIHDNVIANYGVAIMLLTLLFKIIFWPLGNKSYKSMAEMKKLQPLMTDIRKRYKDDKKKMNEEVMGLYRTYKVNPMSGCLPMIVQIPVFIAFYRMLYGAIELRHTPFLLWINDLSAPDRLFDFGITIPFMAPPFGIPVLTIIMGATMFIQQKLSPPPGDPAQAKFMMMMPLIFTVIFINFPSGLVLYWLVNNVVSIGQQYYVTRKTV